MAQHVLSMKGKDSYMSLNVRIFQYHDPSWFHFAWKDVHAVGHVICIYCIYYVISWKNYSRKILSCDYHATVHVRYCFTNQFHLITHAKGIPDTIEIEYLIIAILKLDHSLTYVSWWILLIIRDPTRNSKKGERKDFYFRRKLKIIQEMSKQITLESGSKVQNVEDTGDCDPKGYDSWKDFYTGESSSTWPEHCRISRCMEEAEHGAHVKYKGKRGAVWIIPMCPTHNSSHNKEWMTVNANTTVVEVQKKDANCGKKGKEDRK